MNKYAGKLVVDIFILVYRRILLCDEVYQLIISYRPEFDPSSKDPSTIAVVPSFPFTTVKCPLIPISFSNEMR